MGIKFQLIMGTNVRVTVIIRFFNWLPPLFCSVGTNVRVTVIIRFFDWLLPLFCYVKFVISTFGTLI